MLSSAFNFLLKEREERGLESSGVEQTSKREQKTNKQQDTKVNPIYLANMIIHIATKSPRLKNTPRNHPVQPPTWGMIWAAQSHV